MVVIRFYYANTSEIPGEPSRVPVKISSHVKITRCFHN